jgi:hypothetical protein
MVFGFGCMVLFVLFVFLTHYSIAEGVPALPAANVRFPKEREGMFNI